MTVSFNKNRQRWTFDFQLRGERHQGYCVDAAGQPVASKSAARQAEGVARRLADIAPKLARAQDITIAQVIADLLPTWMREKEWANKQRNAREILEFYGSDTAIASIDDTQIHRYIEYCSTRPILVWRGARSIDKDSPEAAHYWKDTGKLRTPATVNRRLAVLRMILTRATQMRDPLTGEPAIARAPEIKDLREPKRDARPTPEAVMQRLNEILPRHAVDAMVITLCFGFRGGEAFSLRDTNCDWQASGVRLLADGVKEKKDAFLPGSQYAMGYLRCLAMEAEDRGVRHLISYRLETKDPTKQKPWRPIRKARTAWKTAMNKIEAEFGARWRWHDLRAAFITHIAMTSGPLAAQALARHSDFDTTRAYIKVADEMMRLAADRASERPALRIVGKINSP